MFFNKMAAIYSQLQAPLWKLLLFAISTSSEVIALVEDLNTSKASIRLEINFFHTLVNVDILTSSHELWVFFILLFPDPSEELLSIAAMSVQNFFS